MKTKRWVEAKSYSYDGDDWGEVDDYDEYGVDDEPSPPPQQPTGVRHQGQTVAATSTHPSHPPIKGRANSFDRGDESRAFSASEPHPRAASPPQPEHRQGPSTRFSQMGVAGAGPRPLQIRTESPVQPQQQYPPSPNAVNYRGVSYSPTSRQPGSRSQSMNSNTPSADDFQNRRDFSPSAVPQPLSSRASPAPQTRGESPSGRYPPRKSSLSQMNPARASRTSQDGFARSSDEDLVRDQNASPPARGRTASNSSSSSFVRPADIYKRMAEERERERQSLESGRPSLDSVLGLEGSGNLRERTSSESLNRGPRRRTSMEGADEGDSRRLKPMLDPVTERKSEYGFDGFSMDDPSISKPSVAKPGPPALGQPMLPNVDHVGSFGDDFFSGPGPQSEQQSAGNLAPPSGTGEPDASLQHQPSLGFRSVVHQAFDRPEEDQSKSIPPTPSSTNASVGVKRTDSDSTAGISPIMSRVPSASTAAAKAKENEARIVSTPAIAEENESGPISPELHQIPRKPSPAHSRNVSSESTPASFKQGHRRNLSTPSPGNSPARAPAVEVNKETPVGEEASISPASPNQDLTAREVDIASAVNSSPDKEVEGAADAIHDARSSFLESRRSPVESPTGNELPRSKDEDQVGTSRPEADRSKSFRPSLPGGWVSYATTAEAPADDGGLVRSQTPEQARPNMDGGDDLDKTPTASQQPFAESRDASFAQEPFAAVAAAGTAMAEAIAAAAGYGEQSPEKSESATGEPRGVEDRLVSGQSSAAEDEHSQKEPTSSTMPPPPRPAAVQKTLSSTSTIPPTPPPKDTPLNEEAAGGHYFSPPVPLKQRALDLSNLPEIAPPVRPPMLPSMSTDPSPQDQESDRLRKEIVKSLSPMPSDDPGLPEADENTTRSSAVYADPTRESTLLPSEYESYWGSNDAIEEKTEKEREPQSSGHLGRDSLPAAPPTDQGVMEELHGTPPIPPEGSEMASKTIFDARPSLLPRRFSWEEASEEEPTPAGEVGPRNETVNQPESSEVSRSNSDLNQLEGSQPWQSETSQHPAAGALKVQNDEDLESPYFAPVPVENVEKPTVRIIGSEESDSPTAHPFRPLSSEGLEVADGSEWDISGRNGSTVSAVSPDTPELATPSDAKQQSIEELPATERTTSTSKEDPLAIADPIPVARTTSAGASSRPKTLGFREILAMKNSDDRIAAFNATRVQFASMDTGLSNWLSVTTSALPEHADLLSTAGRPTAPIDVTSMAHKSTLSKAIFTRSHSSRVAPQQPYYQQYLNFSTTNTSKPNNSAGASSADAGATPSPASAARRTSGLFSSSPASALSPGNSGGGIATSTGTVRVTGAHVQAKGKDLLHSAGLFGGKANTAARGFLSKGKHKLRPSGAGAE
ncbi:MAG: hypothetical protein M1819_002325 [Sarea resinae]|nr:MAG: hypothetical protein M1819_002325 [Sarea resinae]